MSAKGNVVLAKEHQEILSPPNGGYGWVITLLATVNVFFSEGLLNSIGNLLDTFVQVHDSYEQLFWNRTKNLHFISELWHFALCDWHGLFIHEIYSRWWWLHNGGFDQQVWD